MAGGALKLMAQIVISHASTTELTPQALLKEIKEVSSLLASLEPEAEAPAPPAPVARRRKPRKKKLVESPVAKAVENEDGPVLGDPDYMEFMESREG